MKKIILSAFALFLLFSPQAFAHTYLDVTTPADGDIVTTDIQTLELNYSGQIEEGSFFTLEGSKGNEIPVSSYTVDNGKLTGQLDEPLKNDIYTVKWNSISQDGHPLSGNYSFTVDKEETEPIEEVKTEDQTDIENIELESENPTPAVEKDEQKSSSPLVIAGVILGILIAISAVVLWKRKK